MATVALQDCNGQEIKKLDLNDEVFATEIKEHLVHEVVVAQRCAARAGNAATKTRGMVRGGGRKPWRQKGTGRARAGSTRSPVWRGGGVVFGPSPRSYDKKVSKKIRRAALCAVLTDKLANERLIVVDNFNVSEYKTKYIVDMLSKLSCVGKVLMVDSGIDFLRKSAHNLPKVKVLDTAGLNVYDVLNSTWLVISSTALVAIEEVLGNA